MPREKDSVAQDCFVLSKDKDGKEKATCRYCTKAYVPNATRQRNHILKDCTKVPSDIKLRYVEFPVPTSSGSNEENVDQPDTIETGARSASRSSMSPTRSTSSCSTGPSEQDGARGTKRKLSGTMARFVDHTSTDEKTTLDASFARAVFASGLALSTFNSYYWDQFFHQLRPSYKIPTPYMLSGPLLDREYDLCVLSNSQKIDHASSLGIMTDSYTDTNQESVIDIVITTPKPVLFKQIFRGETRETGVYVGNELVKVIIEIGPHKFLILVTDNAANMQLAWRIVMDNFPHVTAIGCCAHCWNLLFKDLIELIEVIRKYYKLSRNVARTFKKSSNILAVFKSKQQDKYGKKCISLKLPGKTRFAGAVVLLNSLLKNKAAIEETVIAEGLDIDRNVRKTVLDSHFWERIWCISDLLTPIHAAITLIESNRALLSDVYFLQCKINDCVTSNLAQLRLRTREKEEVVKLLQERKDFTVAPIHFAAYMLDPRYQGEGLADIEIAQAIQYIAKLAAHMDIDEGAALANLGEYRTRVGFFATPSILDSARNLHPAVWWRGVCSTQPLAPLAANLLTMPPTAAEVERRWSDHGFIHSKQRNRLLNKRVTKLTTTRSTLVSALNKNKKAGQPLSRAEMEEYFAQYLNYSDDADEGEDSDVADSESEGEESDGDIDWDRISDSEDENDDDGDELGQPTRAPSPPAQRSQPVRTTRATPIPTVTEKEPEPVSESSTSTRRSTRRRT